MVRHRGGIAIEPYPFGKTFAVSLVDDTDCATLAAVAPVYDVLSRSGIRVTKTVWPLRPDTASGWLPDSPVAARTATLQDDDYRVFCQELQRDGHELAMHTASGGDNTRARTLEAYRLFEEVFGHPPLTNIMHGRNRENIYWGAEIFNGPVLRRLVRAFEPQEFSGHVPGSPYFWGDICSAKTKYVRLLETRHPNTLAFDPATPFHDPQKPHVPWWFSATYCNDLPAMLTPKTIKVLRAARGGAILHTYCVLFAKQLPSGDYVPDPQFLTTVRFLEAQRDGWYVPVVELLDRLRAVRSLTVVQEGCHLALRNDSGIDLPALALRVAPNKGTVVRDNNGEPLLEDVDGSGQMLVGDLPSGTEVGLKLSDPGASVRRPLPRNPDYLRLSRGAFGRVLSNYLRGEQPALLLRRLPKCRALLPSRRRP